MTPDQAALAREVTEMRGCLAAAQLLLAPTSEVSVGEECRRRLADIDDRWPAVAALVREWAEREVCS